MSVFAVIQVIENMMYATTMPPIVSSLCLKQGKISHVLQQKTAKNKSLLVNSVYEVPNFQSPRKKQRNSEII